MLAQWIVHNLMLRYGSTMRDALLLDNQLCFALYAASRAMVQAYQPLLEPLGLTYPQYLVLMVLWEEEGIPVKRLGQRLQLDSGTLSPVLKRMEAAGLVTRTRASADERVVLVGLTDAGRALEDRAAEVPRTLICDMNVPYEQLTALRDAVNLLTQSLTRQATMEES